MGEVNIEVAGLRTLILTEDADVAGIVRDRYKGFLSTGTPDWRIEVGIEAAPGRPVARAVVVERDGGPARFSVRRTDFAGTVDLGARCGTVAIADADEISIDAFLRIVYSLALVEARGLVIHAASLVRKERGYLFCGPSGSGKTTISRLSPEAILLSDELSIATLSRGGARCHGTPFWGELAQAGEARSAPLGGIYFLHKGRAHAVEAIGPRQALERLLPNILFFARGEADLTGQLLGISADLVEGVPCFDLSFRPDPGFWELIPHA